MSFRYKVLGKANPSLLKKKKWGWGIALWVWKPRNPMPKNMITRFQIQPPHPVSFSLSALVLSAWFHLQTGALLIVATWPPQLQTSHPAGLSWMENNTCLCLCSTIHANRPPPIPIGSSWVMGQRNEKLWLAQPRSHAPPTHAQELKCGRTGYANKKWGLLQFKKNTGKEMMET